MFGKLLMALAAAVTAVFVWTNGIEPVASRGAEKAAFSEAKIEKIGKHTYYASTLFDEPNLSEENKAYVLEQMRKGDAELTLDVYVSGFNSAYGKDEFRLFGYRMTDGVVECDYSISTGMTAGGGVVWGSHRYGLLERIPEVAFAGREKVRPASEFTDAVYALAKANESTIFRYTEKAAIRGEYVLTADAEGRLFYEFTINRNSTVRVDAITGEVLQQRFWDGVYY